METTEFTSEQVADVVARWWADAAAGKMGGGSCGDGLGDVMLACARSGGNRAGQSSALRDALRAAVLAHLERCGEVYLSVDYGPEGILARVFREVGAGASLLPVKTSMFGSREGVTVSVGYRGATRRLLGLPRYRVTLTRRAPDWDRLVVYQGADEGEARALYEIAASVRSGDGVAYLTRDGDDVCCAQGEEPLREIRASASAAVFSATPDLATPLLRELRQYQADGVPELRAGRFRREK